MIVFECPICGAAIRVEHCADAPAFPFCSRRCRTIDLGRWLDGRYRITQRPDEEETTEGRETGDGE